MGFRSVLALGVILRALLYTITVLHQIRFLPVRVRSPSGARLRPDHSRGNVTPC